MWKRKEWWNIQLTLGIWCTYINIFDDNIELLLKCPGAVIYQYVQRNDNYWFYSYRFIYLTNSVAVIFYIDIYLFHILYIHTHIYMYIYYIYIYYTLYSYTLYIHDIYIYIYIYIHYISYLYKRMPTFNVLFQNIYRIKIQFI